MKNQYYPDGSGEICKKIITLDFSEQILNLLSTLVAERHVLDSLYPYCLSQLKLLTGPYVVAWAKESYKPYLLGNRSYHEANEYLSWIDFQLGPHRNLKYHLKSGEQTLFVESVKKTFYLDGSWVCPVSGKLNIIEFHGEYTTEAEHICLCGNMSVCLSVCLSQNVEVMAITAAARIKILYFCVLRCEGSETFCHALK